MNEKLKEKIRESLSAVLPITVIVLILSVTLVEMELGTLTMFLTGAVLLIVGMGFFQLGAEMAMTPLGQGVGGRIAKSRFVVLTAVVCFVMGVIITISEPDLQVLANQVASIPNTVLILTVAAGVGVFLAFAVMRIVFHLKLSTLLMVMYALLFVLSFFTPGEFVAVAFDSGGVTTGPMTVPFIMALGVGLAYARRDRDGEGDSFGLIAFCSVGPILMVLLLGVFYNPNDAAYSAVELTPVFTARDVVQLFAHELPRYASEVAVSILPVFGVFVLFQLIFHHYRGRQLLRVSVGFLYTVVGLIMFLTGVNVGFAPVGSLLGSGIASGEFAWLLIPIGIVIGFYIVKAEPAVQVLNVQVEEITGGTVTRRAMNVALSAGVAAAVALAMLRVLTGLNIYFVIIPGYIVALAMSRFVPDVFVGIAFDSGGVASGPMTSTFLLPLAMGACMACGGNVVTDAFGIVALVALAPLIAVQIMGLVFKYKSHKSTAVSEALSDDIVIEEDED